MSRRLLGPVSGAIVFFLIAALVFAGLGWVTYTAIGVERAQREAAARAELGNSLRVALWRLDGRMLPALGVEDSRPFFHYAPPDPASTPLLGATLPEWMKLHFQLDPTTGWSSPQVLDDPTVSSAVREAWADLPVQNLNGSRCAVRDDLREKFPPAAACETFAARDRAIAEDPLPLAAPFFANDSNSVQQSEITQQSLAPPSQPTQQPSGQPVAPSEPVSGTSIPKPDTTAPSFDNCLFDLAFLVHCRVNDRLAENRIRLEQQVQNRPAEQNLNQGPGDARQGNSFNQSNASRGVRGGQKDADGDRAWNSYINRAQLVGKGLQEAKNAAGFPMGRAPNFQNPLVPQNNIDLRNYSNFRDTGNNPTVPSPAGDKTANLDKAPGGVYTDVQPPKIIAGAGGTGGFGPPVVATNVKDLKEYLREQQMHSGSQPLGNLSALARETLLASIEQAEARERSARLMKEIEKGPSPSSWFSPFRWSVDEAKKVEKRKPDPGVEDPKSGPTSSGVPAATVPPSGLPAAAPGAPPALPPAALPPVAIHLGSMRPQWITAPDGTVMLILVRTAKFNDRTVYQGVVIDWPKLEEELKKEVADLFPVAALVPVHDSEGVSADRAMTTLPVQLDPGADAELPSAGWTPLRLGLLLAWIAALVAFVAVGFSGWSLIDLAERRIRFVSAVTHELRTPLTSLRLYLDLLVSGMIQDEAKREEYLKTLALESDRLHRLVDNVLDYAKLEKRKKDGDIKPVKVSDLMEQFRSTWSDRVAMDGKELVVISTLPLDREVRTDAAMIQQIVGNLIDNARKYTRDAADKRIWVWAKPGPANSVFFEVEDRGAGVPASERSTIFKPFRRGEQADTKAGGAGLGLALAKSWAEVLGGRLSCQPADGGVGACFRLELPGK